MSSLLDLIEETHFLRMLLTDPDSVIPPGKSLLSMLTNAKFNEEKGSAILQSVTQVAHRAFWSEALDSLSSPLPSVQLPRLRRLYLDLHESMLPLFPPNHPILVSLLSPLAPTSSPLHSTLSLLKELLVSLRQRCAPVRDETVDNLLVSFGQPSSPLPHFVIEMIKAIIALADQMKSDLNTFVIGSMTDSQLRSLLANDVKSRERDLVLKIWGTEELVRHNWRIWLDDSLDAPDEKRWILRLIQALFSDKPVSCRVPTSTPSETTQSFAQHELPPQLFFSAPFLLNLQNHLQAIIITAALRSLTRLPSTGPHSSSDFINRIWTLLKSEINTSGDSKDTERTKIINLADEVVRATQLSFISGKPNTNEEQALRSAVERILRPNDPVFLLLKKRLMGSLEKLWLSSASDGSTATQRSSTSIPEKMITGVGPRSAQETSISVERLKFMVSESLSDSYPLSSSHHNMVGTEAERMVIPGYDDVVLRTAIGETSQKLADCVEWLGSFWGDLV